MERGMRATDNQQGRSTESGRGTVEDVTRRAGAVGEQVYQQAAATGEQVYQQAAAAGQQVYEQAAAAGQQVYQQAGRAGEYLTENAKEYPLIALFAAGVIAYACGYLIHAPSRAERERQHRYPYRYSD